MRAPLVLIVDDDLDSLDLMAAALEGLDVRIVSALDGQEALEKIQAHAPRVVVLDLILPRLTGAQVMATLRARGNDVPVILVSGATRSATIGGGVEFLPKPFRANALREAVQRALSRGG
jgi:CheY-like chemotaxis protein